MLMLVCHIMVKDNLCQLRVLPFFPRLLHMQMIKHFRFTIQRAAEQSNQDISPESFCKMYMPDELSKGISLDIV